MINLIKNELIKLHKRKKTLICLIILVFGAIITFANGTDKSGEYRRLLAEVKKENAVSVDDKKRINNSIEEYTEKLSQYDRVKNSTIDEIKLEYKKNIDTKTSQIEQYKKQGNEVGEEIAKAEKGYFQYLYDHNMKEGVYLKKDTNAIMQLGILWYTILAIIVGLIVVADTMSNEYSKGTIKNLLTTEVPRFKIIVSKLIASIIVVCSMIIVSEIVVYLIFGLFNGFASLNYPKVIYPTFKSSSVYNESINQYLTAVSGTSSVIPMWKVFIKGLILQNLFIVCFISFLIMMSTFIKNNANVVILSIVIMILGYSIQKFELVKYYAHFIFINYLMVIDVITGDIPRETGGWYVSFTTGIIVMIIYSGVFLVITKKYIEKKNLYIV